MPDSGVFEVRRFVLEAMSPVAISGGENDPLQDNLLARDVNGMPMIPATTLAGALRARLDENEILSLLGDQSDDSAARSLITFTDGLAHCGDGRPRDGRGGVPDDKLTELLLRDSPIRRQHVRLNESGVVDGDGKFERAAVPKGMRFTFEVSAWDGHAGLERLAGLIRSGLTLGGATRSGFGSFKCVLEGVQTFELRGGACPEGFSRYADADLGDEGGFHMETPRTNAPNPVHWVISGNIEGPLLIGGPRDDGKGGRQHYREPYVTWRDEGAAVEPAAAVVPGASVKGPLRHRTLFHLSKAGVPNAGAVLESLFGAAAKGTSGGAGKLHFHDVELSGVSEVTVAHVSLDRFTGGARDKSGALFSDKMLWKPRLEIRIDLSCSMSSDAWTAFDAALEDLAQGLVGLGAEWGEGAGIFETCQIDAPARKEAVQ